MALTTQTMTDEQRKSVALEYLKAFDNGGVTSTGGSILDLFSDDAQVYFPKWGLANGKDEIDFGEALRNALAPFRISLGDALNGFEYLRVRELRGEKGSSACIQPVVPAFPKQARPPPWCATAPADPCRDSATRSRPALCRIGLLP